MEKQNIMQIVSEYKQVLSTREKLEKMFNMIADCHVTIGGSYALKYFCEAFNERKVSDYDFILHALPENIDKIGKFIALLNTVSGAVHTHKYYDYPSFYLGYIMGKRINVILKPGQYCSCTFFEDIADIIQVKERWVEKAIKNKKMPRQKDIDDIETYKTWLAEHDLPF